MVAQKSRRASTSRATVGSSSTIRSGLLTSAIAKRNRWVCPPESLVVRRPAMSLTLAISITWSTSSGDGYRLATMVMSSRTLRYGMTPPTCSMAPTAPALIASAGVLPNRDTVPASGLVRPSSMSMVVDLPAPFGPSSATVCPAGMVRSMPRTACTGP